MYLERRELRRLRCVMGGVNFTAEFADHPQEARGQFPPERRHLRLCLVAFFAHHATVLNNYAIHSYDATDCPGRSGSNCANTRWQDAALLLSP